MIIALIFIVFHIGWMIFWNKAFKWYMASPQGKKAEMKFVRQGWYVIMTPVLGQVMILATAIEMTVHWLVTTLIKALR